MEKSFIFIYFQIYTNKCSIGKCKQKEVVIYLISHVIPHMAFILVSHFYFQLVPIKCDSCRQNFCLKHRHPADHECKGFQGSGRPVSEAG